MIHKFNINDQYFVLDVESGTVLEVDAIGYALLGEKGLLDAEEISGDYPLEEIEETRSELESLIENQLLYTKPQTELGSYKHNRQIKALCLHVAHDCNLRCQYCFAGQGQFKGPKAIMSLDTAKKAIDFVVANSGDRHNIEIDFFGGEPLMNLDVVKETVKYVRENEADWNKHFNFTMTTNGLLLNEENRKWLDENMDNVVLSIDGRPEVNDEMRKTVTGDGSYKHIIDNIVEMAKLREGKKDYYVRGTYTGRNLDFAEDVMHFYDKGIKSISIEPVVAEPDSDYKIEEKDLEKIREEYIRLAQLSEENDFNFFHFNINLDGGPCIYKRMSGCGAGVDYLAITPEGEIFPCHQFVSDRDFYLGNLNDGIENEEILTRFQNAGMENKEDCVECWCRYFCGGGCHANAYNFHKDLNIPYELACQMERDRVEAAIMLYANNLAKN